MTILGGMDTFWGPAVGAATLMLLNQQIMSYTEYWPFVLGTILLVLLFVFPGGIVGGRDRRRRGLASVGGPRRCLRCAGLSKSFAGFRAVDDVTSPWPRARSQRSSARTAPASRRCST